LALFPNIPKSKTTGGALAEGLKIWLILSVVVLLGSLTLFVVTVVSGFVYFNEASTPLWVTVLGVVAVLGIGVGFGGLFLVLLLAAMKARKAEQARAAAMVLETMHPENSQETQG
jgi:hypothetical protein